MNTCSCVLLGSLAVLAAGGVASAQKGKPGAVLPGGGNSGKPINIEAVKLDYFDKERKLIYTGNVVATQGDATLKSSVLTILLAPKKPDEDGKAGTSTNQVQRMYATGPVTILQPGQVGTGDNGIYDKVQNTMILNGNVTWSQGPNVTKGDHLRYDLKSGEAKVTGNVKSMFKPDSADDGAAPAPEATATPAPTRRAKSARSGG